MGSYGLEVERRRREITAYHGVPDFVFRPVDVRKGSAQREVGDFLLWVGDVVAIVSHKARLPEAAARESQKRRRSWIDANINDGYEQIRGVARNLRTASDGQILLESERGVKVPWDPAGIRQYVGVVLIDAHAPVEDYAPPVMNDGVPTIAMLAREWDALNGLLPSTVAVINYVARRLELIPRCPVGAELDVFALLVEEEQTVDPIAIPQGGLPRDHFSRMRRLHAEWFFGGRPEDRFAYVVNSMIEGAADADPELSDPDPLAYMKIVAFLDSIPLLARVTVGRELVERCARVGREGGHLSGSACLDHGMLIYLTSDQPRAARTEWLQILTAARHSQALDAGAPVELVTVGVTTQPIPSPKGRAYDFVYVEGPIRSDPGFRRRRDEDFGAPDMQPYVAHWTARGLTVESGFAADLDADR